MPRSSARSRSTEDVEEFDLDLAEGVEDDAEREQPEHIRFNITFYGADYQSKPSSRE